MSQLLPPGPLNPAPEPTLPTVDEGGNVLELSTALGSWNTLMHSLGVRLPAGTAACNEARRTIRKGR